MILNCWARRTKLEKSSRVPGRRPLSRSEQFGGPSSVANASLFYPMVTFLSGFLGVRTDDLETAITVNTMLYGFQLSDGIRPHLYLRLINTLPDGFKPLHVFIVLAAVQGELNPALHDIDIAFRHV
mgnify:CR=1 FL=1